MVTRNNSMKSVECLCLFICQTLTPQLTDDGANRLLLSIVVVMMLRTESDSSSPDAVDTT